MKRFWGYVDQSGYLSIKQYISDNQVQSVFLAANITLVIMPFEAVDYHAAQDYVDKLITSIK